MNYEKELMGSSSICDGSSDLEWCWKADATGPIFPADYVMYACTIWPRTTKFSTVTRGSRVSRISHALFKGSGAAAQHPKIFGMSYLQPHGMMHSNQILHTDQTKWQKFLLVRPDVQSVR